MSLSLDRIHDDLTAAMRSGDTLRRDVLRMTTSAAYNLEKQNRRPLTDDEVAAVVAREVKTRRESVDAFRRGGREDLAAKEEAEIAILQDYLPAQLGEDELAELVAQAVVETGAASPRDMGRVMGWLSPRTKGRADGRHVSELVTRALAGAGEATPDGGSSGPAPGR